MLKFATEGNFDANAGLQLFIIECGSLVGVRIQQYRREKFVYPVV